LKKQIVQHLGKPGKENTNLESRLITVRIKIAMQNQVAENQEKKNAGAEL
jgi:hypothetical protein